MKSGRVRIASLVVLTTTAVAAPVAAVTLRFTNPVSSGSTSAAQINSSVVALTYAPILRFDTAEALLPINRDAYVGATELWRVYERKPHLLDKRILLKETVATSSLPTVPLACPAPPTRYKDCHYYLSVRGLSTSGGVAPFVRLQQTLLEANKPVIYWHYSSRQSAIQYWFFYDFNDFTNYHEGDWEQITVVLDPTTGSPKSLGYSSHHSGQGLAWTAARDGINRIGTHPIVYVAEGSHANYFSPGFHSAADCPIRICKDRSDGGGLLLTPESYQLITLDGTPAFAGDYGTGNYLLKGHKRWGFGINVADPQDHQKQWDTPATWVAGTAPADSTSQ